MNRPFIFCQDSKTAKDSLQEYLWGLNAPYVVCSEFQPYAKRIVELSGLHVESYPLPLVEFSKFFNAMVNELQPNQFIIFADTIIYDSFPFQYISYFSQMRNVPVQWNFV